jgi:hypothetical protein
MAEGKRMENKIVFNADKVKISGPKVDKRERDKKDWSAIYKLQAIYKNYGRKRTSQILHKSERWVKRYASKLWSQKKLDDDIQMTIYSYAYRKIYNKKERGIRVNVLLKRANPVLQTLDTFRVLGDYIEMYNFIMKYIHDVKNLKEVPEHGRYCKVKSLFP